MIANILDALQIVQDMPLAVLLMIDALLFVALLDSLPKDLEDKAPLESACVFLYAKAEACPVALLLDIESTKAKKSQM